MSVSLRQAIEWCKKVMHGTPEIDEFEGIFACESPAWYIEGKLKGNRVDLDYYDSAYLSGADAYEELRDEFGRVRAISLADINIPIPDRKELMDQLVAEGIPFTFKKSTWYGPAKIYVPAEYYPEAMEIINRLKSKIRREIEMEMERGLY